MRSKIEDRGAIGASRASRSDAIEDREAMLSKHRETTEASRSDAPGASQMMTRRGLKGEAPFVHLIALSEAFLKGLVSTRCGAPSPVLVVNVLLERGFLTGEADVKAHWGCVRLMLRFLAPNHGLFEPPRTSD